jgi:hypothetical protein
MKMELGIFCSGMVVIFPKEREQLTEFFCPTIKNPVSEKPSTRTDCIPAYGTQ